MGVHKHLNEGYSNVNADSSCGAIVHYGRTLNWGLNASYNLYIVAFILHQILNGEDQNGFKGQIYSLFIHLLKVEMSNYELYNMTTTCRIMLYVCMYVYLWM